MLFLRAQTCPTCVRSYRKAVTDLQGQGRCTIHSREHSPWGFTLCSHDLSHILNRVYLKLPFFSCLGCVGRIQRQHRRREMLWLGSLKTKECSCLEESISWPSLSKRSAAACQPLHETTAWLCLVCRLLAGPPGDAGCARRHHPGTQPIVFAGSSWKCHFSSMAHWPHFCLLDQEWKFHRWRKATVSPI